MGLYEVAGLRLELCTSKMLFLDGHGVCLHYLEGQHGMVALQQALLLGEDVGRNEARLEAVVSTLPAASVGF